MKKMILLLGAGILLNLSLQAQIHLFLEEQEVGLPDGISTAWVFPITANLEEALDDLKDYCKERSELKLKKGGDNLLIAEKVSLPAIATKRGDLVGYAYITELNYNMALVFQLGYDISLNSSGWASEMESMRNYAKAFMAYHYEQVYARRMKGTEKELKALEKDKGQNENKINSLNNKVANLGKKIGKETDTDKINAYEADIRTLEADAKLLMDALPAMESKISQLKTQVEQLNTESHTYLGTIGGF